MASRNPTVSKAAVSRPPIWVRFWRDRCGVVALAVAVLLPVLIGFAGIGVEVGLWFAIQRQNQSAADAAAISAALEYAAQIESGVPANPTAAAATAANCNLFSTSSSSSNTLCPLPSSASNTITLYPCYGFTAGSSCNTSSSSGTLNAVQVALTQPLNTAFANFVTAIWGPSVSTVNVTTTAIAAFPMLPGGQTCLLAVGSSQTFSVGGSATLNLPNCTLASLSILGDSIQLPGSGSPAINAAAIATAGNVQTSSPALPPHTFTYFPLQDPYKSVAVAFSAPTPPGTCVPDPVWSSDTHIIPSGTDYCGLTISGTAIVSFTGGTYYIGLGGINIRGSPVVTFGPGLYYLYGGSFNITSLSGPTPVLLPTCAATPAGGTTLIFSSGPGKICNNSTSSVSTGMTVRDTSNSGVIPPGTTVTTVTSTTVTISNKVVNPGVSSGDNIDFTAPSGGTVIGSGMTIVLTASGGGAAGGIDIDTSNACSANISLSGAGTGAGLLQPSATASQGLLFFQDPTAVTSLTPQPTVITTGASNTGCSTSNVTLNGAIYTPASAVNLQGNTVAGLKGCTELISQSFTFTGNPEIDDTGCSAWDIILNQAQIQQVYLAM